MPLGRAQVIGVAGTLAVGSLCGCLPDQPMRMEASLDLKGPITMEMRGPSIEYEGTFVSEALFDQVEPGDTGRPWLIAAFGKPDRTMEFDDGSALLVWEYTLSGVQGAAIKIMDLGDDGQPAKVTTIVYVDPSGLVVRKWRG